ncbi:MAG: FAD:protein FMN transferase [Chloroflexi bacterium]|nr:FAD:protein FMN transferase [Chloroflexota bacterium]
MGTAITVDIRAPFVSSDAIDAVFEVLRDIDRRFSLYRRDSELGLLAAGALLEADLSADVRWVLAACDDLARTSNGAFDVRRHRPDGIVDPSALVKGWAVEEAALRLATAGAVNLLVAAGGDIVSRGEAAPGVPWQIGVRHPDDAAHVAAILSMRDNAIATSGLYERGEHIIDPRTGTFPQGLVSLTVVGPDLAWADAYATAGFVMGLQGLAWIDAHPGYGALAITESREVVWTPVIDRYRVPDSTGAHGFSDDSHPEGLH